MLCIAYAHSAYMYDYAKLVWSQKAMRIAREIFSRYNKIASLGLGAPLLRPSWRSWLDLQRVQHIGTTVSLLTIFGINVC